MKQKQLFVVVFGSLLLAACGLAFPGGSPMFGRPSGEFSSNGEQIYLTGINDQGQAIPYQSGPSSGMMSSSLTCAACHGQDGRGGLHSMHMDVMDAPDIRFSALQGDPESGVQDGGGHDEEHSGDYTLEIFGQAVILGQHPDGTALDTDMPRWGLTDEDLSDLFEFIQTLP